MIPVRLSLEAMVSVLAEPRTAVKVTRSGPYMMDVVYRLRDPEKFYSFHVEAPRRVNWFKVQLEVYLLGQVALRFAEMQTEEPNP